MGSKVGGELLDVLGFVSIVIDCAWLVPSKLGVVGLREVRCLLLRPRVSLLSLTGVNIRHVTLRRPGEGALPQYAFRVAVGEEG